MANMNKERGEYPRPQFSRKDWLNLNGEWNFAFDDENVGEDQRWFQTLDHGRNITVPFTYETKASGIGDESYHPYVWYERSIDIPEEYKDKRVILRFQASDYITKVWVNGQFVGDHRGGYAAFSFDITSHLNGESDNRLSVKVEDSRSCYQPRGKQRWTNRNFGCWYVQTTGIWQTVWLEFLNENHLSSVKITPDIDAASVEFDYTVDGNLHGEPLRLQTSISF
ncbi:MAG TPA: beta galactosidase jelly roll domain-containing protein, partial [Bacillales bacterium]|nr:beta galactosidase jelly roll domain-containing protein [Bacillales bacterium]